MKIYQLYRRTGDFGPPGDLLKETTDHSEMVAEAAAALRRGEKISMLLVLEKEIERETSEDIWRYFY